jgi:hypothetical protein
MSLDREDIFTHPPSVCQDCAWSTEQKLLQVTLISQCLCKATSLFLLCLEDPEDATLTSNMDNSKSTSLTQGKDFRRHKSLVGPKEVKSFLTIYE